MSWVASADERSDTLTFLNDVACSGPCTWPNVSIQIAGTFSGKATIQCSNDNANWDELELIRSDDGSQANNATAPRIFHGMCRTKYIRVLATAYSSGTIEVTLFMRA